MGQNVKWRIIQMYKVSSGSSCLIAAVIITILSVIIFGYITHYTDAQNKSTLQLSTNKKTYKPGETVAITLKNNDKKHIRIL